MTRHAKHHRTNRIGWLRAALFVSLLFAALQAAAERRYNDIVITRPEDGSTVFDNSGHVQIAVSPEQELAPGDRFELLLDGHPLASERLTLDGVDRGPHHLQARIVDSEGAIVVESPPVTFYLWQASRNFPSRKR